MTGRDSSKSAAGLLVGILAATMQASAPAEVRMPDAGRFQKGIVLGLFARDEPGFSERNLAEIRSLGADAVSIILPWVTPHVRSTQLAPREDMTPRDEVLRRTIRLAQRLGMRVFLMPLVYVDVMEEKEWRGTIDPPDWSEWFRSYGEMILHYARIAEDEGVAYLSVGSELCSTEGRTQDWLDLIGLVRKAYRGALTYSANWDHREPAGFFQALDYVGTNAYFELSEDPEAATGELLEAWRPVIEDVEAWRARTGKPLVLTEVGYPSRRGAVRDPWDYTLEAPPDPAAQERAYRAFIEAWTGQAGLAGVYFYIWWGEGGPGDTGYTPRGKPAQDLVRAWYLGKSSQGGI